MTLSTFRAACVVAGFLLPSVALATGVLPETSVVIVEEQDGEGAINLQNTDDYPVLLLTTLQDIEQDTANLLVVTPPAARIEPGKTQRVRFMLSGSAPLKTERLKRVIFEGVPPQKKDQNVVRMTVRQNLPVIIRPKGLARDDAPWKRLIWQLKGDLLTVNNPSPYVVRLGQGVTTLPDQTPWMLPGQTLTLNPEGKKRHQGHDRCACRPPPPGALP